MTVARGRWPRGLAVVAAPLVFFVVLELGLRLFGFGASSALLESCTVGGRASYCDNPRFTTQFMGPSLQRATIPFSFSQTKDPGVFRVFILGESAALGLPEPSYSFARHLEVMLRKRYPGITFEVVNAAFTAINSHVILPIARELAAARPDAIIILMGNNEVVGPYGPGTVFAPAASSLGLIRASILLRSTRVGQLLDRLLSRHSAVAEWTGMKMFLGRVVAADSPALTAVYAHFRRNLSDIIDVARGSGAQVLVATPGANLRGTAPFASLHRAGLDESALRSWTTAYERGDALENQGHAAAALEQYTTAHALDDRHAELQYRMARCLWALGRFEEARLRFGRARDLDALRFRADSSINTIIREVAGEAAAAGGVALVDTEAAFRAASPHETPGDELLYEHVHYRPAGNALIARALFPKIAALLPRAPGVAVGPPATDAEAERLLALTSFDRRRMARWVLEETSGAPFSSQPGHEQRLKRLRREADTSDDDDATDLDYRYALSQSPHDRLLHVNYGLFLLARDHREQLSFREAGLRSTGRYAESARVQLEAGRARDDSAPPVDIGSH